MNAPAPALLQPSATVDTHAVTSHWLGRFEAALRSSDTATLAGLFAPECHYRDLLAFSWTIRPEQGAEAIAGFLAGAQPAILARDFALAETRTPPRVARRLGVEVIEAIFRFRDRHRSWLWRRSPTGGEP